MAADLDQFQQLLNTLLSTDNEARTQAEVCITLANYAARRDAGCALSTSVNRDAPQHVRAEHVASVLSEFACGCCSDNAPTTHVYRRPACESRSPRANEKNPFLVANFHTLTSTRAVARENPKWCRARGVLSVSRMSGVGYRQVATRFVASRCLVMKLRFSGNVRPRAKKITRASHAIRQYAWFTGCISFSRPHSSPVAISGDHRKANYTLIFFSYSFGYFR